MGRTTTIYLPRHCRDQREITKVVSRKKLTMLGKRLASCREELERSWRGNGCGGVGDDDVMMPMSNNLRCISYDGPSLFQTNVNHDENEVTMVTSFGSDNSGRVKRRKTMQQDDDCVDDKPLMPSTTEHRLVPDPNRPGFTLHRQIEKTFEGIFEKDEPRGAGMLVTKTVDCAPQVLGSVPPMFDIRFMEVVYDVGMYKNTTTVGEGVRIIYSTTNIDGRRSAMEMTCYRLMNGENTHLKVANDYATWVCHCLGMASIPVPSFSV